MRPVLAAQLAVAVVVGLSVDAGTPAGGANPSALGSTFALAGTLATDTLLKRFSTGRGSWALCSPSLCGSADQDWGADSLTYTLALRERTRPAPALLRTLAQLALAAPRYPAACSGRSCVGWSDVPSGMRSPSRASTRPHTSRGPSRRRRRPSRSSRTRPCTRAVRALRSGTSSPTEAANDLKTLETDGNAIKAALLLYARAARRRIPRDRRAPLCGGPKLLSRPRGRRSTPTYVFDNGAHCAQLPHRFFASGNGNMIWNGVRALTASRVEQRLPGRGDCRRRVRSRSTSSTAAASLLTSRPRTTSSSRLSRRMDVLAAEAHGGFARHWILTKRRSGARCSHAERRLRAASSTGRRRRRR